MLRINYSTYIISEGMFCPALKLVYGVPTTEFTMWPMDIVARSALDVFFFVQPDCTTYKTYDGRTYIYEYRG